MNFEQAITIAITDVLDKLGHLPTKKTTKDHWYLSPFRSEKTASFTVNLKRNVWYDFGSGQGGGIIRFTKAWLESQGQPHSYSDALKWLGGLSGILPTVNPYFQAAEQEETNRIELVATSKLRSKMLIDYLEERGIPLELAQLYLREIKLLDHETGNSIRSIGFKNNAGGYENRTRSFKGCIGHKAITTLRGKTPEAEGVHLFEGFMDFLSLLVIEDKPRLNDNVIVLNSASMLKQALPMLLKLQYKFVYTWFDNDGTGHKATEGLRKFCIEHPHLQHTAMNSSYADYEDVNDWLVHLIS
ncbi:CHC2 zinc finger domain-containing protein [Pseudoflavitalea rhizosphaerae]|uniref:CHC2 zinc finger domain-containing protein n=1 Tax=Pseudoflavitalea rhizosphaerae TaxID=1884793 RepID=UPI000F8DE75F|nr:CHC2 zinc finger domain-containing protein [Pseudoflavitalea rhizosphaerae]